MFTSVRIQNFRQFKDLKLDNLAQINLITGANNTGKTSLLEALFLLDNPVDPTRTLTVASFRGVDRPGPRTPELWEWLFRDRDYSRPIEISGVEASHGTDALALPQWLEIALSGGSYIPTANANGGASGAGSSGTFLASTEPLPELHFDFSAPADESLQTTLRWTGQGLYMDPDRRGSTGSRKRGFFLSVRYAPNEVDADRLSQLEEVGRGDDIVEAMQIVEPRLKRLTVLSHDGRPTVAADVGQYPLVPLAMAGQGFSKLFTILTGIIANDGPVMFIDEIDAGFHHSTLVEVWNVIVKTAIKHSVQIFATTHSYEFLEAAVKGSEDQPGKLAMFRLERVPGRIRAIAVDDEGLRDSIGLGFEMR